jgi:hypothetical protein
MAVSDLDIARTAHQWITLHGESATAKAREMVELGASVFDMVGFPTL